MKLKYFNRKEADNMCKMLAISNYSLDDHEDLSKIILFEEIEII